MMVTATATTTTHNNIWYLMRNGYGLLVRSCVPLSFSVGIQIACVCVRICLFPPIWISFAFLRCEVLLHQIKFAYLFSFFIWLRRATPCHDSIVVGCGYRGSKIRNQIQLCLHWLFLFCRFLFLSLSGFFSESGSRSVWWNEFIMMDLWENVQYAFLPLHSPHRTTNPCTIHETRCRKFNFYFYVKFFAVIQFIVDWDLRFIGLFLHISSFVRSLARSVLFDQAFLGQKFPFIPFRWNNNNNNKWWSTYEMRCVHWIQFRNKSWQNRKHKNRAPFRNIRRT